MKIDHYSFGKMKVGGKSFSDDLLIANREIKSPWWRKRGHTLLPEDLEWIVAKKPQLLVIGTGKNGYMDVPQKTISHLNSRKIDCKIEKTGKAVELFNDKCEQMEETEVGGAFHLTC